MPTDLLQFKPTLVVSTLVDDSDYRNFLSADGKGVRFVATKVGTADSSSISTDSGDFAKWLRQQYPLLSISAPTGVSKMLLRNTDVWLPLAYLANDTSVQIFLNMVGNYLYDVAKGALKKDHPRVHVSAIYRDERVGTTKKFEFSGDAEALAKAIKKFDLNNFFDESTED